MKKIEKLRLDYTLESNALRLSVEAREGSIYRWQYCRAGTADWEVKASTGTPEYLYIYAEDTGEGDKLRCLIIEKKHIRAYSNAITLRNDMPASSVEPEPGENEADWDPEAINEELRRRVEELTRKYDELKRSAASGSSTGESIDFFKGCTNAAMAKLRYRALMQLYHPDHEGGWEEYAKIINTQYERVKEEYDEV